MAMVDKISLFFQQGSSDKFYNICIMKEDDGTCTVPFTFGRRGTSGQSGSKTTTPVSYEDAKKIYDKVVKQKMGKGYKVGTGNAGGTAAPLMPTMHANIAAGVKINSGILPQLLCPIGEDEIEKFLKDPRYGAQEKKDGRRKFMQYKDTKQIVSINKKGEEVGYPAVFTEACEHIIKMNGINQFILDGEEVGEKFYIFDILQFGDVEYRDHPYEERYAAIDSILMQEPFELLPLAVTETEKRALYKELQEKGKEGIIFKLLAASYTEGRLTPEFVTYEQMCPQVKAKFYATASCIVIKKNVKRSVQLGLYNESNELTFVGNCTISPNKDVPEADEVVEIRYLYAYKGGSLYQPTYLGPRDDVDWEECLMSQLKYKAEDN